MYTSTVPFYSCCFFQTPFFQRTAFFAFLIESTTLDFSHFSTSIFIFIELLRTQLFLDMSERWKSVCARSRLFGGCAKSSPLNCCIFMPCGLQCEGIIFVKEDNSWHSIPHCWFWMAHLSFDSVSQYIFDVIVIRGFIKLTRKTPFMEVSLITIIICS